MTKRSQSRLQGASVILTPGLSEAPVLDLMCTHFVVSLAVRNASGFNPRRDFNGIVAIAGRHLVWPLQVLARLRAYLGVRCAGNASWRKQELLDDTAFIARFGAWRGPYDESTLFFFLDDYARDHPKDLMALMTCTREWLQHSIKKQSSLVEKNINVLVGLLQLNQAERAVLLFGTLARYQREMRSVLVEFKVNSGGEAFQTLAEVTEVNPQDLGDALRAGSRLERVGLVDNLIAEHCITDLADLMKVSEKLPPVLLREYRDQAELMAVFTRLSTKTLLRPEDFSFVAEDARVLSSLLATAAERREPGINILLYGPPGTGKTELAKVLAQDAGLELFEVEYADRDGNSLSGRDRYRALQIAQVFLKGSARAALLFDEVEDVFPPLSMETAHLLNRADNAPLPQQGSVNGKAWVNQILEGNAVPTIWITNRIEQIDLAFRRRFAYHLELKSPPPGARESVVRKTLEGVPVSQDFLARVSARKGLTPAQIRTALRFAELACPASGEKSAANLEQLMERQLTHADRALGNRRPDAKSDARDPAYRLEYLNVECRYDIARILQALGNTGQGTLCFVGPPGTGKTALARHMADQLGRTLVVRQASNLISKYVGETEQNMAAMFDDAQAESAVLLLDEADSFLQDRRAAQRSYEVTEVNEMLQGMEHFRGIFICTTNMVDRIDQAALRRFTFKISFRPLTREQREALFLEQACSGDSGAFDASMRTRLARLDLLCLGDVDVVRRQAQILGISMHPQEFLEQLEAEHRSKPEIRDARAMGFFP